MTVEWTARQLLNETTEELVAQLLLNLRSRKCIGCEIRFPLFWDRRESGFWYHEDGGGGIICERHPDNEEYWRRKYHEDSEPPDLVSAKRP